MLAYLLVNVGIDGKFLIYPCCGLQFVRYFSKVKPQTSMTGSSWARVLGNFLQFNGLKL